MIYQLYNAHKIKLRLVRLRLRDIGKGQREGERNTGRKWKDAVNNLNITRTDAELHRPCEQS